MTFWDGVIPIFLADDGKYFLYVFLFFVFVQTKIIDLEDISRVPNGFAPTLMVLPPLVFRNLGNFAPQGRKIWDFLKDFKGNHGPLMVLPPPPLFFGIWKQGG